MPRPIPDNPETITGWRYYLIALPDDDVSIRAAWDAFSELTHYWNWGEEGVESDSETIAQIFADALYETARIRDMGFPDLLLEYVDEVEELLRAVKTVGGYVCCDDLSAIGEVVESDVTPGIGDAPSTYGDAPVTDWPDWYEHLCAAAHLYVDARIAQVELVRDLLTASAIIVGAIASVLTIGGVATLILKVSYATAAAVVASLVAGGAAILADASSDLEAARDDIVCAIINGESLSAAIEAAVDPADWTAWFQWLPYSSHYNQLKNGTGIDVTARDDCTCDSPVLDEDICQGSYVGDGVYASVLSAGCHILHVRWNMQVEITSTAQNPLSSNCGGDNRYRVWTKGWPCGSSLSGKVYDQDANPPTSVVGDTYVVKGNAAFTVEIDVLIA